MRLVATDSFCLLVVIYIEVISDKNDHPSPNHFFCMKYVTHFH